MIRIILIMLTSVLSALLLTDIYAGALTTDPHLQGWIAVLLHGMGLCCVGATCAYLAIDLSTPTTLER